MRKKRQAPLPTGEKKEIPFKQGRIHGKTVADGWAGAVMQIPFAIQKYLGPTDRHGPARFRVACPRLKTSQSESESLMNWDLLGVFEN